MDYPGPSHHAVAVLRKKQRAENNLFILHEKNHIPYQLFNVGNKR